MVFGLVGFTLAVTIVRGSIFGGVYKSIQEGNNNQPNITWIWFWFYVEFTICKFGFEPLDVEFWSNTLLTILSVHNCMRRIVSDAFHTQCTAVESQGYSTTATRRLF